jgi:pyruvate/2-oxoglutarate dehydrogenase complex dihydrolipoamide dehydrogenase (E3) component
MELPMIESASEPILPWDAYNQQLLAQVHPPDWVNPVPADMYDLVVIGAGPAGLVVAAGAAGLGLDLKVALIEKNLMGGDCLNVGCVPSKSLIGSGRIAHQLGQARALGAAIPQEAAVDFGVVMERLRRIRSTMSHHDSAQRFQQLGVDVFLGQGTFLDRDRVGVGDLTLRFKKAVIATGARASQPEIEGLATSGFLTNETIFSLTERPRRLAVIGGGPIGCELAQAFRRLGSEVVLLQRADRLLPQEDPEAGAILEQVLVAAGVQVCLGSCVRQVISNGSQKQLEYESGGQVAAVTVDEILVGTGRSPNVQGLNLAVAGVEYDDSLRDGRAERRGVQVNDYLQTTNPKIYGAGDVCMDWKFTHAADAAARIVLKNALFSPFGWGKGKLSDLVMPRVTFTEPEVAQVGEQPEESRRRGIEVETIYIPLSQVDRAVIDQETAGFFKIYHQKGTDRITGATIVANHGGEMISEVTMAIANRIGLGRVSGVIHPYPTQCAGFKQAADHYRRGLLTPRAKGLLRLLLKLS